MAGVTLVETIVFLVVVSVALVALVRVFSQGVVSLGPDGDVRAPDVVRVRALELAQAKMDEILARKFDENTPTGGVPACNSVGGGGCLGIAPDGEYDDVGDYHGHNDSSNPYHTVSVTVTEATAPGFPAVPARLITVSVSLTAGDTLVLSAYKANF